MCAGSPVCGFDDEEGEAEVNDGGGEGEEEVNTGMAVTVAAEVEAWEYTLYDPEQDEATDENDGAIVGRNVVKERFHTGIYLRGFNGALIQV